MYPNVVNLTQERQNRGNVTIKKIEEGLKKQLNG